MHKVDETYATRDRWPLSITRITPNKTVKFNPTGTDYVLLAGAGLRSKTVNLSPVTAACTMTAPYEVSCQTDGYAAVISYPGLCLHDSTITMIDPTTQGNMSYMDGGTNSNAINPSREGDPVVNYVHFPAGMNQTPHVHPSHRIGLVIDGEGRTDVIGESIRLSRGDLFYMGRMELHHFITEDKPCVLFVFAPDSETGPTDEVNPLKARTYIDLRNQHLGDIAR